MDGTGKFLFRNTKLIKMVKKADEHVFIELYSHLKRKLFTMDMFTDLTPAVMFGFYTSTHSCTLNLFVLVKEI